MPPNQSKLQYTSRRGYHYDVDEGVRRRRRGGRGRGGGEGEDGEERGRLGEEQARLYLEKRAFVPFFFTFPELGFRNHPKSRKQKKPTALIADDTVSACTTRRPRRLLTGIRETFKGENKGKFLSLV